VDLFIANGYILSVRQASPQQQQDNDMNKLLLQYAICQAELTRLETACAESEARHGAWEMPCHRHRKNAYYEMCKLLNHVAVYLVDTYPIEAEKMGLSYKLSRSRRRKIAQIKLVAKHGLFTDFFRPMCNLLDGLCAGRLRRKYNDSVHVPLLAMMDAVNA